MEKINIYKIWYGLPIEERMFLWQKFDMHNVVPCEYLFDNYFICMAALAIYRSERDGDR